MRLKPCLTTPDLRAMAAAANAEAQRNGWRVTVAIVDDGGHLLFLERDGAKVITADVATRKARTAALTHNPSGSLQERIKDNPHLLALDAMPLQGGLPIVHGGECIGGIGVSGVLAEQDEQVCRAALDALAKLS
jgi:glc operon protein GlcG